ncbi:hypothetical protein [Rhodococcus baikonurensis]|uniref:F5/8 type C domain-containing protein n=1 Tax=Rhodococcus baikonurensis TaxID=172041 RepID=A0ABV5XUQ3_9NOCA
MSRPLSDDERRSINVNKIDDALAAFASTPIDELDADKWMADLDDALTPGHTRRPLEVPDEPVVRTPKRSMHHEVGGDDDADEDVQHLPTWDDDDVVGDTQSTVDDDARVDVGAPEPDDTTTPPPPENSGADEESAANPVPDNYLPTLSSALDRNAESVDPGLQLSAGFRDLLARRPSAPPSNDFYGNEYGSVDNDSHTAATPPPSSLAAAPPASAPRVHNDPYAAAHNSASTSDDTAAIPTIDTAGAPAAPPPIPLRGARTEKASAPSGVLGALRERFTTMPPWRRKAVKFLAPAAVLVGILVGVNSCTPDEKAAPPPVAAATPDAGAPATTTGAATAIPVPESAVGVLAPSAVSAKCPEGSTDARFAFTADKSQAWICKRALGIDGAVMEITFPYAVVISDVFLTPGFDYIEPSGIDRWVEHRTVSRVQWSIGNQRFIQEINPSRTGSNMPIPEVKTQKITLTIMATAEPTGAVNRGFGAAAGAKDDSFAISLIRITGHQP